MSKPISFFFLPKLRNPHTNIRFGREYILFCIMWMSYSIMRKVYAALENCASFSGRICGIYYSNSVILEHGYLKT